jgi:hypothetical protein
MILFQFISHGLHASSHDLSALQTKVQLDHDSSMEPKQEVETDGDTIHTVTPQLPRKQALSTRKSSRNLQDKKKDQPNDGSVAAPALPAKKKSKPKLAVKSPQEPEPEHIKLDEGTNWQNLLAQIRNSDVNLRDLQTLEVHLDAGKLNEYADSMLAVVFTALHPLPDGTNPHDLQTIQLVVNGKILFTRYSYHLVSPVLSDLVGDNLKKLVRGKLSEEEKKRLPYTINATEKTLADALLGIRGVKQVSIDGKGHMEADFAATIKATLTQEPGASIVEAGDAESQFSMHQFKKLGTIFSDAYSGKAHCPYPTVPGALKYDFSRLTAKERFLIDEKLEIAAHLSGQDDHDAQAAAVVARRGPGSNKLRPTYEVGPIPKSTSQTRRTMGKKEEQKLEDEETDEDMKDEDNSLGLMEMITINKTKALSGEETVELGWRV